MLYTYPCTYNILTGKSSFRDIESNVHDESYIRAEDEEGKESGGKEEVSVQKKGSPVPTAEKDDYTAKKASDEAATSSSPGTGLPPPSVDDQDEPGNHGS